MKKIGLVLFLFAAVFSYSQNDTLAQETTKVYKKRVLENIEIDILGSFYTQRGDNAAVTGGIGTEMLTDFASNISVSIPLSDDDIFSIDGTVSAYSSASSGNLNPFSGASSGASSGDDDDKAKSSSGIVNGSPWVAASGASQNDVWINGNLGYAHYSDSRNTIYNAHLSIANEFDYFSTGFGGGFNQLFNQKNTEIGIKANIYLDTWRPEYPTEIIKYNVNNGNLNIGFFEGVSILDQNGNSIDKLGTYVWKPSNTTLVQDKKRNTYSVSLSFSQILSKRAQISLFSDIVIQEGWLSNPMQRVYFSDVDNFYIGEATSIPFYTTKNNKDVFQLADDIERLPNRRFKMPIGLRLNYYINEFLVLRTYYRYYFDDWNIKAHTLNLELPVKMGMNFTLYPSYRYYIQTAAKYFAPYEAHSSKEAYYTSDYDLSAFQASQFGLGLKYNDPFTKIKIWKIGLKSLHLDYSYYQRNTGLYAHIVTIGAHLIVE